MAAIVVECIDSLLKHALLVADDDLWGLELKKRAETVIAVDDTTVEIVQIGCRKTPPLKRNKRTKVRRDDGQDIQNHPFGTGLRGHEPLDKLETLRKLLADLLALGLGHLLLDGLLFFKKVQTLHEFPDRFSTHSGDKILSILILGLAEFDFRQELSLFKRSLAGINDDVILVIDHALKLATRQVKHEADPRRHALVEPNMGDRNSQINVAHALTPDAAQADLDTASVTNHVLVLDALILTARALPVTGGSEDPLAEQSTLFRLERPVVDGLRILDFTLAPTPHCFGVGNGDSHLIKV